MSQGFNPRRHRPSRIEEGRWAMFAHAAGDPIPTDPEILRVLILALQGRVKSMDRTIDKRHSYLRYPLPDDPGSLLDAASDLLDRIQRLDRTLNKQLAQRIRLYVRVIAQRDHWPGAVEINWRRANIGHYDDHFRDELAAIEKGKLIAFGCLPAVLRLQRDHVYSYMARSVQVVNEDIFGDGYADGSATRHDSPRSWLKRNGKRLYGELVFWQCSCLYKMEPEALDLQLDERKRPGELIPAVLQALHNGNTAASIYQLLKPSARPGKIPPFLA